MTILSSINPWTGEAVASIPAHTPEQIAQHVDELSSKAAAWAANSSQRIERLQCLSAVCEQQRARMTDLLIREAGKTTADAEAETALLPKKIQLTLSHLAQRTPQAFPTNTSSEPCVTWRPRGVAAIFGPYNFPLHLLHGLVVPALAVGCPVIAKPSERCPALGQFYRECIAKAGLDDVCRIVLGDHSASHCIIDHPAVATIAAVGGAAMGAAVHQRAAQRPSVVTALELGGVNPALVRSDADVASAATMIADGAWRMAGQRCTATRVVHIAQDRCDKLIEHLTVLRRAWLPGVLPSAQAGPMINRDIRERFHAAWQTLPEGLRLIAGTMTTNAHGTSSEPLLFLADRCDHPALYHERFGPYVIIAPFSTEADEVHAITAMRANPYRLSCSIFTPNQAAFTHLAQQLPYGIVNRNRPTAGARSDLPFGGCGLSGNGRPAAIASAALFADETVVWP